MINEASNAFTATQHWCRQIPLRTSHVSLWILGMQHELDIQELNKYSNWRGCSKFCGLLAESSGAEIILLHWAQLFLLRLTISLGITPMAGR